MEEVAPPTPLAEKKAVNSSCLIRASILVAILIAAIGLFILWYNRPIRPVVLTDPEKSVVQEKLATMQSVASDGSSTDIESGTDDTYIPGKREITFTDRELNGLLHQHTTLGDQISFQFTPGNVLARIATPLPDDIPVIGGTTLRARAKFAVDASGTSPKLALEDFTVWGISIPNDWLGGIKNVNLLGQAFGTEDPQGIPGVESLSIEKGHLLIRLKE